MMKTKKRTLAAAVLAAALAGTALAAGMQEQTSGNIRYLSGGIGQDEAMAMRQAAPRYPLALTFTDGNGEYLSDVNVVVKDRSGNQVLTTVSDGPMLLVDLPPGQYTVESTFQGKTFTHKVSLAKRQHRRLVLRWPATGETG